MRDDSVWSNVSVTGISEGNRKIIRKTEAFEKKVAFTKLMKSNKSQMQAHGIQSSTQTHTHTPLNTSW